MYTYIYFTLQKKLNKVVKLVGGGSVINGAYPVFYDISISYGATP